MKDDIHLTLDKHITVVFRGVEIIEEEISIANSCVYETELYHEETRYELHFLVMKRDENLIARYYYITYAFQDLSFID